MYILMKYEGSMMHYKGRRGNKRIRLPFKNISCAWGICARCEVSMATGLSTDDDTNDDDNTRRTIHDFTVSLAFVPDELNGKE